MVYLINILIFCLAFILRSYGINWDQGFHLHPDERMLIMVTERIHFFDKLNPDFFNYGSLPIYILKGTAQFLDLNLGTYFANYDGMLILGRYLSIFFDLGTILFTYKIATLLFKNKKIAAFASFFYSIAFFPIQNSHFFVVDVFLTFFTTLLILLMLKFVELPSMRWSSHRWYLIFIGVVFAAMLSTKFSAVIFYPIIILVIIVTLYVNKQLTIQQLAIDFLIFNFSFLIFNFIFMPYAFLEYKRFISDITDQTKMNSDAYIFPYTLQYVGTLPYLYFLKNIFFWGLGPIISLLSFLGFYFIIKVKFKIKNIYEFITNDKLLIVFFLFNLFYFLVIGRSAVKFMRYILPIYPFFTILAGYSLNRLQDKSRLIKPVVVILALIWTVFFINIYSKNHTRIAATEWIHKNIAEGSTIALEHWDDGLPLRGMEKYNPIELPLYERPDDEIKWNMINVRLNQAEYIIIASNRLYTPLQKLADCDKYKSCYPLTSNYYKKLFAGKLAFKKVAEFTAYPGISLGKFQFTIDDSSADESFSVYDHPKIMIFKKI